MTDKANKASGSVGISDKNSTVSGTETKEGAEQWRVVNRTVFPVDADMDVLPLYIDYGEVTSVAQQTRQANHSDKNLQMVVPEKDMHAEYISGREGICVPSYKRVSLGTYFNAFPASYWYAHTSVRNVKLSVQLNAPATVVVYRSSAKGTANRIETMLLDKAGTVETILPLSTFGDGGWYWYDIVAGERTVNLVRGQWAVETSAQRQKGSFSLGITTFNRPDYCLQTLETLAGNPSVRERLDTVYVVDQGSKKVCDEKGYKKVAQKLGSQLTMLHQGNLGGSGGFSRSMKETLDAGKSDYVMLLDDDVLVEPEGILRALDFGDFTRKPMLIGGHMFNLHERSVLHALGEDVKEYRWFWGPVDVTPGGHDFKRSNLRATPWLHRRIDVDYNGWWMDLIPVEAIREIGLALPLFIKWDDSEYGLRAKAAGYQTVSFPGAAIWHVSWDEKDDSLDWQAFFHQRNRWLIALMYSPYKRGGVLTKESFMVDVKHTLSMQYSAVKLRLAGLKAIFDGPDQLQQSIRTIITEVRQERQGYADAAVMKEPADFPEIKRTRAPKKGRQPVAPRNFRQGIAKAASGFIRQLRPVRRGSLANPEARVPHMDARWWRLANVDSALVSTADGSGVAFYKRDPEQVKKYIKESIRLHRRLFMEWDSLAQEYRSALKELTSPEEWQKTFDAVSSQDEAKK